MSTVSEDSLKVHLPPASIQALAQDEEFFEIEDEAGERRRLRCHDYNELYTVPGLYEKIFYDVLHCRSPEVVVGLLGEVLDQRDESADALRTLDLGAGNGMVAEELEKLGADHFVGVDLLEEAKLAAERDRPGLYDAYHAVDLTALDGETRSELGDHKLNCLVCVAALGFGDIPADAFRTAFDLVEPGGWIAFNIRDEFVSKEDKSGFAKLLDQMYDDGELVQHARERYQHRVSVSGDPIHYIAVVSRKQ